MATRLLGDSEVRFRTQVTDDTVSLRKQGKKEVGLHHYFLPLLPLSLFFSLLLSKYQNKSYYIVPQRLGIIIIYPAYISSLPITRISYINKLYNLT